MDEIFIRLVVSLATCEPSNEPGTDNHRRWTDTLKAIYRMNHPPAHAFLASINLAGIPNEAPESLLLRAHQMAKGLLPSLLRDLQTKEAGASETEHEKFVRQESSFDPFLENANLTRDAYSGRGEVEPEQPVRLDRFGNCVRD
jgi:hypothetical protein